MAYCTTADLYANVPGLTANNQKAPASFLNDVISRKCEFINSMISSQYEVPVVLADSPAAFLILKDICIELSKLAIADKLDISVVQGKGDQKMAKNQIPTTAMDTLELIRQGKFPLRDAVPCNCEGAFPTSEYDVTQVEGIPWTERTYRRIEFPYNDDDRC